ncbi:MAG: S8 family serine peptidase [Anaerolineae bacterium]|nr:S8 family serine peptidase [Anaerolineae bacterium]
MNNRIKRTLSIIGIVFLLLATGTWSMAQQAPVDQAALHSHQSLDAISNEDHSLLTAIVVVRAASGASYMADRDYIATMPALETMEEVRAFVATYEPLKADANAVRASLEDLGFKIVAQDNLFLVISGTRSQYGALLEPALVGDLAATPPGSGLLVVHSQDIVAGESALQMIDGLVIGSMPVVAPTPATRSEENLSGTAQAPETVCEPPDCYTVDDIAEQLRADQVHGQGRATGAGVNIGIIDEGVLTIHPFFWTHPLNAKLFKMEDGNVTRVNNNYDFLHGSGHGTMVASFLASIAPDATICSFSLGSDPDQLNDNLMAFLVYMHQHNLVDVFSLSQSCPEENPACEDGRPDFRTAAANLIANGTIVLVSAGNAGQCDADNYCSGHNVAASVPEVIAVGGANTDFSAAGGYPGQVTGAASFESDLEPGRFVPDVVGFYGPHIKAPRQLWTYEDNTVGTSGATPQVAGIVALLKQQHPSLTQFDVRSNLENSTWDIVSGESGDGHPAGFGYDLATGHGLPLATWVLDEGVTLSRGWNLVGLTKEHSGEYTAVDLLNEINTQSGYSCDNVSRWDSSTSTYKGVVVNEQGNIYGFDFPLELSVGYWLRCRQSVPFWRPSGTGYVDSVHTIQIRPGWNFFSIPYSDPSCTAGDALREPGIANCDRIYQYDGQMQQAKQILPDETFGYEFPLSPGQGYIMYCDEYDTWTPDCSGGAVPSSTRPAVPRNYYDSTADVSGSLVGLITELQATGHQDAASYTSQNVRFSNIGDRLFSVSWTTEDPCMGSVVIHNGSAPTFRAFDDRGLRFSGTTHHVTIRGLEPDTTYSFGLLSGDVWDDNVGSFYQVRTGEDLNLPSNNYDIHGQVVDNSTVATQDAIVYVQLEDRSVTPATQSTLLSFPLDEYVEAYALTLDNTRTEDASAYFDYASATHLIVEGQGGSADQDSDTLSIDLGTMGSVTATTLVFSDVAPHQPTLTAPTGAIASVHPIFRFASTDSSGDDLTYRLELSTDNFATVERIYDQRDSTEGWSATSYASGEQAQFTIPDSTEKLMAYQWRVFAHNGEAWSSASDIVAFSNAAYYTVYLPLVLRNSTGSVAPGPTATPDPSATPWPTPTNTPEIPPPNPQRVSELTAHIKFDGRSSTDPEVGGHNVPVHVLISELDGTVRYSAQDVLVTSGTTADTDYGTFTLSSLTGHDLLAGTPYRIFVTGAMHLTGRWSFTAMESHVTLTLTDKVLLGGDLNQNNMMELPDYDLFIATYLDYRRNPRPIPQDPHDIGYKCDLNGDRELSMDDYALFVDNMLEWPDYSLAVHVKFQGRSSTDPNLGDHGIVSRFVIRELDGTVVCTSEGAFVRSGETSEEDYGTFKVDLVAGQDLAVGQEYEILVTGAMHLTRKWSFVAPARGSTLNLTDELLLAGDLDASNLVDMTDYDLFIATYQDYRDNPRPIPQDPHDIGYKCDFNGDGELSMADYSIFNSNYGVGGDH